LTLRGVPRLSDNSFERSLRGKQPDVDERRHSRFGDRERSRALVSEDFRNDGKSVRNGNTDLVIPAPVFLSISPTFLRALEQRLSGERSAARARVLREDRDTTDDHADAPCCAVRTHAGTHACVAACRSATDYNRLLASNMTERSGERTNSTRDANGETAIGPTTTDRTSGRAIRSLSRGWTRDRPQQLIPQSWSTADRGRQGHRHVDRTITGEGTSRSK